MGDSYPSNIPIEIDRERLTAYLRAKSLLIWVIFISVYGTFFGAAVGGAIGEHWGRERSDEILRRASAQAMRAAAAVPGAASPVKPSDILKMGRKEARRAMASAMAKGIAAGAVALLSIGFALFFYFSPRAVRKTVENLEASVEGAFLRVRQGGWVFMDRKLHFRAIVDYATTQGPLMRRYGIHGLRMTTTALGQGSVLTILGVKDCLRVRDMLSEIDRLREGP